MLHLTRKFPHTILTQSHKSHFKSETSLSTIQCQDVFNEKWKYARRIRWKSHSLSLSLILIQSSTDEKREREREKEEDETQGEEEEKQERDLLTLNSRLEPLPTHLQWGRRGHGWAISSAANTRAIMRSKSVVRLVKHSTEWKTLLVRSAKILARGEGGGRGREGYQRMECLRVPFSLSWFLFCQKLSCVSTVAPSEWNEGLGWLSPKKVFLICEARHIEKVNEGLSKEWAASLATSQKSNC